jgi:hypothetical protein
MTIQQDKLPWVWWDRDEPEDGLTGFHTAEDRDRFSRGDPGPFRRRISEDGHTVSQMWEWADFMADVRASLRTSDRRDRR